MSALPIDTSLPTHGAIASADGDAIGHGDIAPRFADCGLPTELVTTLAQQGLHEAVPIQAATLPDSLAGRDILGKGRTGSGKTLAFALPMVTRLAEPRQRRVPGHPRGLVLVPTRELATQVAAVLTPLAEALGMRVTTIFGGAPYGPQRKALADGVEIIVACPGRLLDHLDTGTVNLDSVSVTVIDEADHMADQGFLPVVRRILKATPVSGQRMLFSATLEGGVGALVDAFLDKPVSHVAQAESPTLLEHRVVVVRESDRVATVASMARKERVVVFTRTKRRAQRMARDLKAAGVRAVDLHGDLPHNRRQRHLDDFSRGSATALVATDIAARGIHVDDVPLVVHADPPVEHKAYVHRSGRTARAGAAGQVVTVTSLEQVEHVRSLLNKAGVTATWEGIAVPEAVSAPRAATRSGGRPGGARQRRHRASRHPA